MVTIKVGSMVHKLLSEYKSDDESMEDAVIRLLDCVSDDMDKDMEFGDGSVNINVSRDTMSRIKSYKVRDNESYGRILHRALVLVGDE